MKNITRYALSLLFCVYAAVSVAEDKTEVITPNIETHAVAQVEQQNINPNAVNINTATVAEMQDKLVGIGTKKAQAIVEYREKNGPFVDIEQITEVSGIGPATLNKNRERILLK